MNVYEYSPPNSNKKATGIVLILFSLAAGLFMFTILFPTIPLKWLVQLISIIAFVAVIFIISRYILKKFLYAILKCDDDTLDFTVSEITNGGFKQIIVCRISIKSIEEAHLLNRSIPEQAQKIKQLEQQAKSEGRKSYNYCPDINPTEVCILLVKECGENFLLKLSPDSTLWEYFKK